MSEPILMKGDSNTEDSGSDSMIQHPSSSQLQQQQRDRTSSNPSSRRSELSVSSKLKKTYKKHRIELNSIIQQHETVVAELLARARAKDTAVRENVDDADWNFCKYLYSQLKTIADGQVKSLLQLQIQQAVFLALHGPVKNCSLSNGDVTSLTESSILDGSSLHLFGVNHAHVEQPETTS